MEFNLTALGIGLAVLFFGYFFGLFEGRGQGYKRRKKEEEEEKKTQAAIQNPLPPPGPPMENSLLRLHLGDDGKVHLDLEGQRVDTASLTPDQRKRLIDLMVTMRPWVEGRTPQPVPPAPLRTMPPGPPPPAPGTPPPATPPPVAPTLAAKDEPTSTTMVGQIDSILQAQLAGTHLADRGIRLIESPGGTVTVMVGMNRYNGVGEVPETEIQAVIRAAIAEWEKKFTPGTD